MMEIRKSGEVEMTTVQKAKAIFSKYFSMMETFQFSQACELLKQKSTTNLGSPWTHVISPLLLLQVSEGIYYNLNYLEPKWISKNHLELMYNQTMSDLSKALRNFRPYYEGKNNVSPEEVEEYRSFCELVIQTGILVGHRSAMVTIYRKLAEFRGNAQDYDTFIKEISEVKNNIINNINHPFLVLIRYNTVTELTSLLFLFQTQKHLGNYNYKESVFSLYQCKSELDAWKQKLLEIQNKKADVEKALKSGVFLWISTFLGAMHSKLTLYFYDIISSYEKSLNGDMTSLSSQLDINYHSNIENFILRSQCQRVILVMDASSPPLENGPTTVPFKGYEFQMRRARQGLDSWPAVFAYPKTEQPDTQPIKPWANVVSLIMDNSNTLDRFKEPIHYYDKKTDHTYFISKIEVRLFVVIYFKKKKKKNDDVTQTFLFTITTHLRNWQLFSRLKPQTKN